MASFPPIQFKRSTTPGASPAPGDLLVGEVAINLRDRIIYTKNDSDQIVILGANPDIDSDIIQIVHDYLKNDSDQSIEALNNVILKDSENGVNILEDGFTLLWDSDQNLWKPGRSSSASAISELTDVRLDSDGVNMLEHGFVLAWDSDSDMWKPRKQEAQTPSSIATLIDVRLDSDGTNILEHGFVLAWDSDSDMWKPRKQEAQTITSISDLTDVDSEASTNVVHGSILSWDSDRNEWKVSPSPVSIYTAIQEVDKFLAVQNQTGFSLSFEPSGKAEFFRNGVAVVRDSISLSGSTIIFDPTKNNNQVIDSDDEILVAYVRNGATTQLPQLHNVDKVKVASRVNNSFLVYSVADSDSWINTEFTEEAMLAIDSQTEFTLSNRANLVTGFYRNGMRLTSAAYSHDSDTITYIPAGNGNNQMDSDDEVQITYFK